jgi:hypothetical protein
LSKLTNNGQAVASNTTNTHKTSGLEQMAGLTFWIVQQAFRLLAISVIARGPVLNINLSFIKA